MNNQKYQRIVKKLIAQGKTEAEAIEMADVLTGFNK